MSNWKIIINNNNKKENKNIIFTKPINVFLIGSIQRQVPSRSSLILW